MTATSQIFISTDGRQTWQPVEREKALRSLSGHWNEAEKMLAEGTILWTPFAFYKETTHENENPST